MLCGMVDGHLYIVKGAQRRVGEGIQAVAVGGHGQLNPLALQVGYDVQELGVQAVLSGAHTHGVDR